MIAESGEAAALEKRLEDIEKQCRVLKVVGLVFISLVGVGMLAGPTRSADRTVEAERLILLSSDGKVGAKLDVEKDAPGVSLYDQNGVVRAGLEVGPDGSPALWLYDEKGKGRAALSLAAGHAPFLEFYDSQGGNRVSLRLDYDNQSALLIYDKKQKRFWSAF